MRQNFNKSILIVGSGALVFGVITIIAGSRVLLGGDPGYVVYKPLVWFNTVMGGVYLIAGVLALKNPRLGIFGAAVICILNLAALGALGVLYSPNGGIADMSLKAMAFRSAVWLVILAVLVGSVPQSHSSSTPLKKLDV